MAPMNHTRGILTISIQYVLLVRRRVRPRFLRHGIIDRLPVSGDTTCSHQDVVCRRDIADNLLLVILHTVEWPISRTTRRLDDVNRQTLFNGRCRHFRFTRRDTTTRTNVDVPYEFWTRPAVKHSVELVAALNDSGLYVDRSIICRTATQQSFSMSHAHQVVLCCQLQPTHPPTLPGQQTDKWPFQRLAQSACNGGCRVSLRGR